MRSFLAVPLLGGLVLLASASAPAPAEAQRTGSSVRPATAARGTTGALPTGRSALGVRQPRITWPGGDPFRIDRRSRFPDRRARHDRRTRVPPIVYHYPIYYPVATERVIHVRTTEVVRPRTITVAPAAPRTPAVENCAIVTVLQPDYRGYWKELRLPAAGARNTDELQRVLDARAEEGAAFTIRDAAGETLEVPAASGLDRIVVDRCR